MGKTHKKIVIAGVCCLMISMLTGCGNDTTKITEGMQLVETLDYQGALTVFEEAEAQKENSRLIARGRGIASMGLTWSVLPAPGAKKWPGERRWTSD